jgi:hypothetical protein
MVDAAIGPSSALAIDAATGPIGTNVDAIQNASTFGLLGTGVNIGQVEPGRPGDPQVMTPAPAPELNHNFVNPGGAAVGVADGNVSPPAAATPANLNRLDSHATEVAGVMNSQNPANAAALINRGVAPGAILFSSAYVNPAGAFFQQNNVVLGTEWVLGQGGATVPVINYSFGEPINEDFNGNGVLDAGEDVNTDGMLTLTNAFYQPGGNARRDGMNLAALYLDWRTNNRQVAGPPAAVQAADVLFVMAGPEQGPPSNSTPDDAYNNIVVGMTQRRAAGGRFDQIHPGQLLNQPLAQGAGVGTPVRNKIDLVAPGGNLVLPVPGGAFTVDTFTDTNANGLWNTVFVDNNGSGGFDANEPYIDLDGSNTYNAATEPFIDANFDGIRNEGAGADYYTNATEAINDNDGNLIINLQTTGTSFAAPHVAGVAAMLHQRGVAQGANYSTHHLVKKATLMNSASKHVLNQAGTASWTTRYENGVTPPPNPNTPASTVQSLDSQIGTGQLNAVAALRQYQAATGNTARSDMGVNLNTVNPNANSGNIPLAGGQQLKRGSLVTATLAWDRTVALTAAGANLTAVGSYNATAPSNLDLQLVNTATNAVVFQANSTVDNAEHIYFNVPADGNYALRVVNNSGGNPVQYGLTWSAGTSDGIAFSVDGGINSLGQPIAGRGPAGARPANPAEGLFAPFGDNPYPNDVNALGTAGAGFFPTEGEIFTSSQNGTNMQRISGALGTKSRVGPHNAAPAAETLLGTSPRGVLGLVPNDNVNSLSWGYDGTSLLGLFDTTSALLFSVDTASVGAPGTNVNHQATLAGIGPAPVNPLPDNVAGGDPGGEAAGDIYVSPRFGPFGKYLSLNTAPVAPRNKNNLLIDEGDLGLQAPQNRGGLNTVGEDDLDALEMTSPLFVDQDGDGMHGDQVFFTLDQFSPTITGGGAGFAVEDVLVSSPADANDAQFNLNPIGNIAPAAKYADGRDHIGLMAGDVIDALVLSDVTPLISAPFFLPLTNGALDRGLDEALFSLAPGSPTLAMFGYSAADIFYTDFDTLFFAQGEDEYYYTLFASAASLGLLPGDNVDALDIFRAVPEPSGVFLMLVGIAYLLRSGRRYARPPSSCVSVGFNFAH